MAIIDCDSRVDSNEFVDIPIVTGMGIGRNIIIVRSSQSIIAIGGEFGTLSEISYALQLGIPVIGINTWDISENIHRAESAKEAVQMAFELMG